ncbi:MAG: hypothetical protein C5B57_10220 [Blastocatellia bacterium]|nr:MAG: hypothetical protein C5B57_10220 [Blastocatellia bacterium]
MKHRAQQFRFGFREKRLYNQSISPVYRIRGALDDASSMLTLAVAVANDLELDHRASAWGARPKRSRPVPGRRSFFLLL